VSEKKKWYQSTLTIVLFGFLLPPIGLVLAAINPHYKNKTKLISSSIIGLWFVLMLASSGDTKPSVKQAPPEQKQVVKKVDDTDEDIKKATEYYDEAVSLQAQAKYDQALEAIQEAVDMEITDVNLRSKISDKKVEIEKLKKLREEEVNKLAKEAEAKEAAQQQAAEKAAAEKAANTFTDGTYLVNTDIKPGTYRGTLTGDTGYWARLRDTSGGLNSIIANGLPSGPFVLTISSSDNAIEIRNVTLVKM